MSSAINSFHSASDGNHVDVIEDDDEPIRQNQFYQNQNPAADFQLRFHDGLDEVGYESDQLNSKKYDKLIQSQQTQMNNQFAQSTHKVASYKKDFDRLSASHNRQSERAAALSKVSADSKRISKYSKKSVSGASSKRESYRTGAKSQNLREEGQGQGYEQEQGDGFQDDSNELR